MPSGNGSPFQQEGVEAVDTPSPTPKRSKRGGILKRTRTGGKPEDQTPENLNFEPADGAEQYDTGADSRSKEESTIHRPTDRHLREALPSDQDRQAPPTQSNRVIGERLGKAGKTILGRLIGRRKSASGFEPEASATDKNYICTTINLPLVQQTRKTRIAPRLELSKDKTEFWMPALPWRCIAYLSVNCEEAYPYHNPGSASHVKLLQRRFDTEYDINLEDEPDLHNVNIICSVLRSWLRELPDEILPKAIQDKIAAKYDRATPPEQLFKDELSGLPPFNYFLLFAVTCLLSQLLFYSDKNKSDYESLCIFFQPCLKVNSVCFEHLVLNWKQCWQGCWTERAFLEDEYRYLGLSPESIQAAILNARGKPIAFASDGLNSDGAASLHTRRSDEQHFSRKGDRSLAEELIDDADSVIGTRGMVSEVKSSNLEEAESRLSQNTEEIQIRELADEGDGTATTRTLDHSQKQENEGSADGKAVHSEVRSSNHGNKLKSSSQLTGQTEISEQYEEVPTDSGYASETRGKSVQARSSTGRDLEVITEDIERTHKDSVIAGSLSLADEQNVQNFSHSAIGTAYSASETSTLPLPHDNSYIVDLAMELFSTVKSCEPDRETLERISEMLPDLLRTFALRLGSKAQSQMHRDVSFFVHKYRRRVQDAFEELFPLDDDISSNVERIQLSQLAISRFLNEPDFNLNMQTQALCDSNDNNDDQSDPASQEPGENDYVIEHDVEPAHSTGAYRDFIVKTSAYSWLVASLQREATLTRANPDIMEDIRGKILGALPSRHKISRKTPSQEYKATFKIGWSPLSFVKEQQYSESQDVVLERAITLTGDADDAQAATTADYLSQTWPATGKHVMRLVTDVVRNITNHNAAYNLPDGTELQARIEGKIAQQFAWLGAALRSSQFEAGVAICTPFVQDIRLENSLSPAQASAPIPLIELFCVIDFKMNVSSMSGKGPPGQCWHNMFRNPVMVSGYPIRTKHEHGLGLEIPLNMIAALTGSARANEFDGKIFIKGFSTMLTATKVTRDLLIWHYFYNERQERISYLDHNLHGVDDISLLQLDTARHVVGWCSDCMYYAGAADARYDIDGTNLPRPHSGCLLEKVSISGGKIITGGMQFAVGVKDVPPHLTRNGYIPRLKWIATKYVVLWDEADKRGWLVNGTSALLHLVRASLEYYSADDFSSSFLFDPSKMKDAAEHKPSSAPQVLIDNRDLEIYPGRSESFEEEEEKQMGPITEESKTRKKKRGYYLFEDLVEQHYNILEQIMDHQRHRAGQDGVNLKLRVRKHLEGWDFFELATDHDPSPRVATLRALGYGWVDFVRSIDAVTLFGRGFGDIIRPVVFDGMCPTWRSLPTQRYYLAASVLHMKKIMRKFGDPRAEPPRPVHELLWHCPGDLIASCRCLGQGARQMILGAFKGHHDPVQIFYPKLSRLMRHTRGPGRLEDGGAAVFGHNVAWGYRWKDNGAEDIEEMDLSASEPVSQSQTMTPSAGSSSELSNLEAGLSIANQSYQSSGSTAGVTTLSSASANSTGSTPAESIVTSDPAVLPPKPDFVCNVPLESSQRNMANEDRLRSLRHEKRRLPEAH